MTNALEQYREKHGLTYEALGKLVGYDRPVVWRHCKAKAIPASAAPTYNAKLKIPMKDLLPDLYEGVTKS
ncbi:hypothetical protein [Pseudodesulfovibrio sp.]|uniref:hypothetical protein n=1 Tax=unclassified Pseudodesulfovibrio TaxID=2661612 RepID=UPI003B0083C2